MENFSKGMEKRRFLRIPIAFDPRYPVDRLPEIKISCNGKNEIAHLLDISKGGIGFVSKAEFSRGVQAEVSFELEIRNKGIYKISAAGVVRNCSPRLGRGIYRIGLEFEQIDPAQLDLIVAYVESFF